MLSNPYPVPVSPRRTAYMLIGWTAAAGAGLWVLGSPPVTYEGRGLLLTAMWGILLALGGLLIAAGHAFRQYRIELPGLIFALGGLAIYCYLSWEQVLTTSPGSGPRALILIWGTMIILDRGDALLDHDRRMRRIDKIARG